jgi:hypothetical protein
MHSAFVVEKAALAGCVHLIHPTPGAEVALHVDASAEHISTALQQRSYLVAPWWPLGFFLRKLDTAQVKYSSFHRELLACVAGFWHFRHMLEGRRFTFFPDHKPLTYALSRTSDPWSACQAKKLSCLAEHTDDIRHIAGEDNIVADTLSCPPSSAAASIKEPSRSLAAAWQGGKPESSSISGSGSESAAEFAVPATGQLINFAAIAAHQPGCRVTLQASKTPPSGSKL